MPLPVQHYLYSSITSQHTLDSILHLLRGLCEDAACGSMKFQDHEITYSIKLPHGTSFCLKARKSLLDDRYPWLLSYYGTSDVSDHSRPVGIRTCIQSGTSPELPNFLTAIGFQKDFELIIKGHVFQKEEMKIIISQFFSVLARKDSSEQQPISKDYLIELSAINPKYDEKLAEKMKNFAEQLKPLVFFEKVNLETLA